MSESSPLNETDRAELVAYLDGELHGESARAVESRIAKEPAYRSEAETLKCAWDMLDYLPRPEPSPDFTHRTVEKLVAVTMADRANAKTAVRRPGWLIGMAWAAGILVALLLGYILGKVTTPPQPGERELVRDLRVIENKKLYETGEDLEFVRELDLPELFGDDTVGG